MIKTDLSRPQVRIEKVDAQSCPNCESEFESINLSTDNYYDKSSALYEVGRANMRVGAVDWNDLFVAEVGEFSGILCPDCGDLSDADEWGSTAIYPCRHCGTGYGMSHEALRCCSPLCGEEAQCFCTDGVQRPQNPAQGFARCYCDAEAYEECPYYVCLICHTTGFNDDMVRHMEMSHPKVELKIRQGDPNCEICNSEFCCMIHEVHRSPHLGCESDPTTKEEDHAYV